jgi:putative ABC transport system permease protein
LSYDTYHKDADRIYRVGIDIQSKAGNRLFAQTSAPLAAALEKDFPQVETAARLWRQNNRLVKYGQHKAFMKTTVIYRPLTCASYFNRNGIISRLVDIFKFS